MKTELLLVEPRTLALLNVTFVTLNLHPGDIGMHKARSKQVVARYFNALEQARTNVNNQSGVGP
jgi:hypothetical protein